MKELDFYQQQLNMQNEIDMEGEAERRKVYAPDIREKVTEAQAAVIAQTNPARAIRAVVKSFEGIMINEYDEEIKIGEPLMNSYGIARISSYIIPIVNDATRFGNIKEKEVRDMTLQIIDDITDDIGYNWREYGVKNHSAKDLIVDSCLALILITLTRSENEGEKRFLSKVILESLSANQGQQKKKSGGSIWDKFKF